MTTVATRPDLQPTTPPAETCAAASRIWGLSADQLHDAFWRARGVQVVRWGEPRELERAADAYLLLDPGQLVLFDLPALVDRLIWHNARVTRLRLIEPAYPYHEQIVADDDGRVRRIERRYESAHWASHRVVLTTSRLFARRWMNATSARAAWLAVRRSVSWAEVDHCRRPGAAFIAGRLAEERRFIDELVRRWPTPDQSIAGLEEVEPGVWREMGATHLPGAIRVAPLWLGYEDREASLDDAALVGPAWVGDGAGEAAAPHAVFVRPITDVAPADRAHTPDDAAVAATSGWYPAAKRLFDVAVSAIALIVFAPLLALIALVIMIDDGRPVFFGHTRQTRGGRSFRCWKFRTMRRDAERMVANLSEENVCDGPQVFIRNDPRVTRVGRVLRKTNLDELPQLWNVLTGGMSLVGPRPSPDGENQFCPAWRELRLSVRPGITGLWQLKRRREPGEDFQEWIKYDIEYVRRASFVLDLRILVRTARMILFGRRRHASE